MVSLLMGDVVEPRKKYIYINMENFKQLTKNS